MKDKNVFGQSICEKEKCLAYHYDECYGGYCDANLYYTGRINEREFGMLCKLPVGIELRKVIE